MGCPIPRAINPACLKDLIEFLTFLGEDLRAIVSMKLVHSTWSCRYLTIDSLVFVSLGKVLSVDTFEVKKLDATWYYRCESRGIAAAGPGRDWTQKDAVKAAIKHAAANPPAEILVYDDNGQSVIIVHRVGVSGEMPSVE